MTNPFGNMPPILVGELRKGDYANVKVRVGSGDRIVFVFPCGELWIDKPLPSNPEDIKPFIRQQIAPLFLKAGIASEVDTFMSQVSFRTVL